jgi:hypothetical protein
MTYYFMFMRRLRAFIQSEQFSLRLFVPEVYPQGQKCRFSWQRLWLDIGVLLSLWGILFILAVILGLWLWEIPSQKDDGRSV